MRTVYYLLIAFFLLLAASCTSDNDWADEITVSKNRSSKLKFRAMDSDNQPLDVCKISIYEVCFNEFSYQLLEGLTNKEGEYDADKLLEGKYTYTVVATKGKTTYYEQANFQMMVGVDLVLEINPLLNSGTFVISVVENATGKPLDDYNDFSVALLPSPDCYNVNSFDDMIEMAHFTANLDADAKATIKYIPSTGKPYRVFVYNQSIKDYTGYYLYNVVQKGDVKEITIRKN